MAKNAAIFQKSAKGQEAIATRSSALGPRLRSVLIMVDGRRSAEELAPVIQGMGGDPKALLEQLESEGYIVSVAPQAMAETVPAPLLPEAGPDAGPESGRPRVPLAQAQRFASRLLTDMLGPDAEQLCMRIEGTRNDQEFRAAVRRVEATLRDAVGPAQAARFVSEVEALQPK
jgi:hypothetical protein